MDVVIDANELFSCIIAYGKGLNNKTIDIFFDGRIKLHAPTKLLEELKNNEEELAQKSGLSVSEYEVFLAILKLRICFVPLDEFGAKLHEAEPLMPHLKDIEYFALALKLNAKLWSQEKAFKKQTRIETVSTNDLFDMLK